METKKRKVITRSGRHLRCYFPSIKTGKSIPCDSPLERDAAYLFEFSPGVRHFADHQRLEIYYNEEGNPKKYYPDFLLELVDGSEVVIEVKPEAKLKQAAVRRRFEQIAAHFQARGIRFLILTDREIRRAPRLENIKHFAYHAGDLGDPTTLHYVAEFLRAAQVKTLFEAEQKVSIQVVAELVREGLVACPWDDPVGPDSAIKVSTEGEQHAALLF